MMKENYERTALTLTVFDAEDVIVTSTPEGDRFEDDILKPNR